MADSGGDGKGGAEGKVFNVFQAVCTLTCGQSGCLQDFLIKELNRFAFQGKKKLVHV